MGASLFMEEMCAIEVRLYYFCLRNLKMQMTDFFALGVAHFTGPGDLRVTSELISLKERYPDRVHLILGNRDINKLRIPSSLHSAVLSHYPKVYWVHGRPEDSVSEDYKLDDAESKMKWVIRA